MAHYESDGGVLSDNDANNLIWSTMNLDQTIEQARRRVLNGEKIENTEKLLSIFERETEWINREKFPLPYEFGHRVFLAEGKSGIILDYSVGPKKSDLSELSPMLERLNHKYGQLNMISLDKGFWRKGVRE
jgi:transposase, IS5 family